MARLCHECGALLVEDWQYRCNDCEGARLVEVCLCYHDERDQCLCYDGCPYFDICAGWTGLSFVEMFSSGEPEPVTEPSDVNPAERRAERGEG